MSEANVAAARWALAAFYGEDVEDARDLVHEDFEFVEAPDVPDAVRFSGENWLVGSGVGLRAPPAVSRIVRVTDRETASIRLELKRATEPITGFLFDEHGGRQPFRGWLSLLSVLDDVTSRVAGTPDGHAASPAGHVDRDGANRREVGDEVD